MEPVRILIVDDEEDLVSTMAERLALRGFQVETTGCGIDAIGLLLDEVFGVVILDVKLPGIDGLETMAEIIRQHPDLPVILLTGHGSAADAERGMKEGAFDYLVKPIDLDKLIDKIRSATGGEKGGKR
jgi:DNA-binding NtrC family response regulator